MKPKPSNNPEFRMNTCEEPFKDKSEPSRTQEEQVIQNVCCIEVPFVKAKKGMTI